jgi:HD-GYP domain-containing protein (c-di-GMP phosphodiesterase class II)
VEKNHNGEAPPLYNSRIFDTYIRLIKKRYPHINVAELLSAANMAPYEIADQGHWFTQDQINLFHDKLVQFTDNDRISREAGRFATSPESIGAMRQYILGMLGPAKVYSSISKAARKLTRSTTYESRSLGRTKVEIVVRKNEGVVERPFQCENRMGFLEAISILFNNKTPRIEHPECMFRGHQFCRYIISWEKTYSDSLKKIRNYTALTLIAALAVLLAHGTMLALAVFLPIAAVVVLFLSLIAENREKRELLSGINNLETSNDRLLEQIEINYNNALMVNEIGLVVSMQTSIEAILKEVTQIFQKRLNYDRGIILLVNEDRTRLAFRAGFGYSDEMQNILQSTRFRLDLPDSKGVFIVSFREKKPFIINDMNEISGDLSEKSMAFARIMKSQSFICCPILCDGEAVGILAADNVKSKRPLIHSDMSLLMGVASVIGISIRNADLHFAREKQFRSTLQVLAASIDARDPLTAGHSEKVTQYAMAICDRLNLSREYCEVIRVAAALHDYGKIGVPDALLKKEGRLTMEEYEVVKTHAAKTREILEQINFQGLFSQVPAIASAHHEKIDGTGYPLGLEGDSIPLGAQIISVADFYEAITSTRHYRAPMPEGQAIALLRQGIGTHFKEEIVENFINCLKPLEH